MNAADSIRKSNKQRWIQTASFKEASENILLGVPLKVEKRKLPTEKLSTILKEHNQHGLHNSSPARKLESILKKKKEPKNSETMQKMKKVLQNKKEMKRMYNRQQRQQQNPSKLDVAICGIYQGFDLINLGSSLKLSYIGQKQKTLSGQRYTLRSMVLDSIMSKHCSDPVVVFEGYSVRGQGSDRWSAPIEYKQKEKSIWGEKVPPSHMTQIKNTKRIQRSASKSDESETVFEVQTLDQLNLAHEHAVEPLQNGDIDEAIHRFMKILRSLQVKYSCSSTNTPENHVIASTLHNIAILYTFNMQFEVALNYITQAVNMRVKCLGYYHSSVAVSFAKQGMIYFALETLGSSVRAFEQALDIQIELSNNSDRIQTSKLLNNIGVAYFHLGEKRNALDRLMRALKLQKQRIDESLSRESSIFDTSITLSNLGKVFLKRRDYSMATYVYEEAVMIQTSIFSKDHPIILESLGNVAYSKAMANDKTNALEVYKSLLEMQLKQFGEKSRDVFETKALMGILYTQQSNYSVALRYFNEAYEWQKLNLDSNHPALRFSKNVIDQLTSLVNGDNVAFVRGASSTAAEI
jgi:tetratricopeptide (TPR) repeat protein